MKKNVLIYLLMTMVSLFSLSFGVSYAETCWGVELSEWWICCGDYSVDEKIGCDGVIVTGCAWIKLNTNFPIIWNCINVGKGWVTPISAFPTMMSALTKIVMSLILVVCFITIIVAWVMRAWAGDDSTKATKAKWLITKVAITILLLWFSWAILRLINPNFFS